MGIQDSFEFLFTIFVCILLDRIYINKDSKKTYKYLLLVFTIIHMLFFSVDTYFGLYFPILILLIVYVIYDYLKNQMTKLHNPNL